MLGSLHLFLSQPAISLCPRRLDLRRGNHSYLADQPISVLTLELPDVLAIAFQVVSETLTDLTTSTANFIHNGTIAAHISSMGRS